MAVNCCGEIAAGDFIIAADIAEDGTIPDGAVGVGKGRPERAVLGGRDIAGRNVIRVCGIAVELLGPKTYEVKFP